MNPKRLITLPIAALCFGPHLVMAELPPEITVPIAVGCQVNEASIRRNILVSRKGKVKTLQQAFRLAHTAVKAGIPTKVTLSPGTYREAVLDLDWTQGKARETLLVIEGKGTVIWSGADVFPASKFRVSNGLWSLPWKYNWGNFAYSWSAKGLVGHRSEMVFVNGEPLFPRILEQYDVDGMVQDPARPGEIAYRYRGLRDPAETLAPGQFGVTERVENGQRIFFRPKSGRPLEKDSIEIAVRRNLLDLRGKSNVVSRNITFTKTANNDGDFGANNAVRFSIDAKKRSNHVLIDRCKVLWSAQSGLHIDGDHWTIRNSEFSFNGGSGIASGKSFDILFENNRTNYNVWRLWLAGELGYYTGGFKMHETTRHTIRRHEAIGNLTMGSWWDVHCRDVRIQDLIAVGNAANLQFELSEGPFIADRILLAAGRSDMGQLRLWEHGHSVLRNSILYSNYAGGGNNELYELRWFGRDDQHSRMAKITAGQNFAENNIFAVGPGVANVAMLDDIRGRPWSEREPMSYHGKNNVFWHPTDSLFHEKWIINRDRRDELAARATLLKDWLKPSTYEEMNPQRLNPAFENPAAHDYRFSPSSALFKRRLEFPQFRLGEADRRTWRKFTDWIGFNPDAWNEPPKE